MTPNLGLLTQTRPYNHRQNYCQSKTALAPEAVVGVLRCGQAATDPDATNARSSQVYILPISEIVNDRLWPKAAPQFLQF